MKWIGRTAGLAAGATAAGTAYLYNTDPGIKRTMQFSAAVTPMTLAYGYNAATPLRSDEEKDRQREILHKRYAPEMLRIILDMRGYYIKATQMMVGAGMLPDAYEEHLKVLLDEVPARPLEVVKGILEAELGCPTEEVFESFSDTPIGAASIGQVHLAKIKGSGTPVVVKIQ